MSPSAAPRASDADLPLLPGSDGIPLYVRVASALRARIFQGGWRIGERLPAFEALATQYGVALNTMCVVGSDYTKQCTFEGTPQGNVPIIQQSKTVTPTTVQPGGTVQYTIQVSNIGSAASNSPVPITDYLPSGFTYQSLDSVTVNGADGTAVTTVNSSNPQQPIFTVNSSINAGQDLILKFTALVSPTILAGTYCNQFNSNAYSVVTSGQVACVTVAGATIGDTIFAVLNACGHNIRKILAHLRAWLAWIIAVIWTTEIPPNRRYLTAGAA